MTDGAVAGHTSEPSGRLVRVVDILVAVTVMLAGLVVVAIWVVLAPFSIMATDTCGADDCDLRTFAAAMHTAWIAPPVIYLVAVACTFVRIKRHRSAWWVPVVGSAAAFAVWYTAYEAMLSSVAG